MTSTLIPFEQIANFRDLAFSDENYSNQIYEGRIFRCANPANASKSDREAFKKLNIDLIFDLRDEVEIAKDKLDASLGVERIHLSLLESTAANPLAMHRALREIAAGNGAVKDMLAPVYDLLDEKKVDAWRILFDSLNNGKNIVIHCTAGRDRTGITVALIQLALGMEHQRIIEDHLLSNLYLQELFKRMEDELGRIEVAGVKTPIAEILHIQPWMMETFLKRIDTDYGSSDNLLDYLGADLDTIRSHYMKP